MFNTFVASVTGYGLLASGTAIAVWAIYLTISDLLTDLRELRKEAGE